MRVITVKIEEDFLDKMDLFCKIYNINRSDLVRVAVKRFMEEVLKNDK